MTIAVFGERHRRHASDRRCPDVFITTVAKGSRSMPVYCLIDRLQPVILNFVSLRHSAAAVGSFCTT